MFRLHMHRGLHTASAQAIGVRRGWPWLAIADVMGLALAGLALQLRLDAQSSAAVQAFTIAVLGAGLATWLVSYTSQRELPGRFDGRVYSLVVPLVSAMLALTIFATFRMYYSGSALLLFVLVWTAWMALGRMIYALRAPTLRLLLPEGSSVAHELGDLPNIRLTTMREPPSHLNHWDAVVVDPRVQHSKDWLHLFANASLVGVPTLSAPLVIEKLGGTVPTDMLEGAWANEVFRVRTPYRHIKRIVDVLAITLSLPILLPTALMVALVVWLDCGKPILFKQWRVGKDGKPFLIWKFRTMRPDSEQSGAKFATKDDSRITATGRFLRKYRLDELPQFWNVLKGDMSIIGPRPEQETFVQEFSQTIPLYDLRHSVLPGITGWAQVRHGYAAGKDETHQKLRHDLYYVKNLSLILDLEVVVLTIRTILTGFGSR